MTYSQLGSSVIMFIGTLYILIPIGPTRNINCMMVALSCSFFALSTVVRLNSSVSWKNNNRIRPALCHSCENPTGSSRYTRCGASFTRSRQITPHGRHLVNCGQLGPSYPDIAWRCRRGTYFIRSSGFLKRNYRYTAATSSGKPSKSLSFLSFYGLVVSVSLH